MLDVTAKRGWRGSMEWRRASVAVCRSLILLGLGVAATAATINGRQVSPGPGAGEALFTALPSPTATPGLPFTEDFSSTALRDSARTNANWSQDEQALILAWRKARYGTFISVSGTDVSMLAITFATNSSTGGIARRRHP